MANNNNKGYIDGGTKPENKPPAARDFLSRAFTLDRRINRQLAQITALKDMAQRVGMNLSDMPKPASRDVHSQESIIAKYMDLENDVTHNIDTLIDVKAEIAAVIEKINSNRFQTVLDLRYLQFMDWDKIAEDMNYSSRNVRRIHVEALELADAILKRQN